MEPEAGVTPRILLFGGAFDPPHSGHLTVAREAGERLAVERVLLIPACVAPLKEEPSAPPEARLRMVRALVAGEPLLEVSDLELRMEGQSFTVDTLRALREEWPRAELLLLMGVDQWAQFGRWKEPQEILRLAELVVMARGGVEPSEGSGPPAVPFQTVAVPRVEVSSSGVRERVRLGKSIDGLVPDAVRRIIEAETLYLTV